MIRKSFTIHSFAILVLAQVGTTLVGCSDEPPSTVICDNPCQPDIFLRFTSTLPEGQHHMRLVADLEVIECTFVVVAGQVESSNCGNHAAYVLEEGIVYWNSPETFEVEHNFPDGCSAKATYSPKYHKWYSFQCDVACREWEGTFDVTECAPEGMGGGGGSD